MGDYLKKLAFQVGELLKGLSPGKKIAMVVTGVAVVAGLGLLFIWAGQRSYRPLFTNLNPDDANNIMRVLREKNIPFGVDPTGRNIEVPPEVLHDARLSLATMGFPSTSVVGYEIFDKQSLGVTSYVQKMNSKRALEGELMRTIGTIRGVKRSRVHLAIPQKSTFSEEQKRPSASVVLDLDPGVVLSEKQIYGMGILPNTSATAGYRDTNNARIAAACAAQSVTYWNTDGWIVPATDTSDGLHPNETGAAKIMTEILTRL